MGMSCRVEYLSPLGLGTFVLKIFFCHIFDISTVRAWHVGFLYHIFDISTGLRPLISLPSENHLTAFIIDEHHL